MAIKKNRDSCLLFAFPILAQVEKSKDEPEGQGHSYLIARGTDTGFGIRDLPQKKHYKGKIQAFGTKQRLCWDHF